MDSTLHFLQTKKTARVFTSGLLNENTKYIWFLLHGYAQTADHLLNSFKSLGEGHFFVAPEGLNHFYARGLSGAPVASWMTSLMREEQIKDYIEYLDLVFQNFYPPANCKVIVSGFSQGVSTLCRWVNAGTIQPDHIVFIAGSIAGEMQNSLPESLNRTQNLYLFGSNDALIDQNSVLNLKHLFNEKTSFVEFQGKHEVNENCLQEIRNWLDLLPV